MSFVRPGRKPGRRKITFVRKKPQWDDSVTDLDSYRATPEEVAQRKEAHKSKNHLSVKLEKLRKERQSVQKGQNNAQAREVAIVKEVLHNKQQLQRVLSKTDKMLATVEDLFGDDAKKFTGHPNVTLLSGGQSHSLPAPPKIQTRIEKLSESVTSQSALNDLSDSSEEEEPPDPIIFHPGLDIQQFQQFVTSEEENYNSNAVPASIPLSKTQLQRLQQILLTEGQDVPNTGDQSQGTISGHPAGASALFDQQTQVPAHSTCLLEHRGIRTPPNSEETDCTDRPTRQSALNDTGKLKKSRRRVQPTQSAQTSSSSFTMTDMRQMLDSLQAEVADFEHRTGRRSDTEVPSTETFSGYTQQLLTVIAKLIHYFKETDLRLQAEIEVRERLSQDVQQLAGIVNFQTQEMIESRLEYGKLEKDFLHFRQEMQGEMALLRAEVLDLKHQQSAQASNHSTPVKAASASSEPAEEKYSALPDQFTQASAAVLLSPVVRKTRVCDNPQPGTAISECQQQLATSLSSSLASCNDPPHLTQTLPVMATVNVPRPIPLVQSNVGLPLSGSQAAGPLVQSQSQGPSHFIASMSSEGAAGTVPTGLSASASSTNYKKSQALDTQIAELNRKHAEAEQRLQSLLVQQERQMNHLTEVHRGGGEGDKTQLPHRNKPPVVQEGVVPSVSPPISPIPHQPKSFTQPDPIQRLASMSRQIQITMPAMDLEISGNGFSTSH